MISKLKRMAKLNPLLRAPLAPATNFYKRINSSNSQNLHKALSKLFCQVEGGSLTVRVEDFGGTFEIGGKSHILHRILVDGYYEPEVVQLLRRNLDPKRDVIDIGANVGLFSILFSRLISRENKVLAVEPTPGALGLLHRNIRRNECPNVEVFEGIAAKACGEGSLNVICGMEEYSSTGVLAHPAIKNNRYETIPVRSETIDNLVDSLKLQPGLIKIDAEGSDYEVLLGAGRTLLRHKPVILCEEWPEDRLRRSGGEPGAVGRLLRDHGYLVSNPLEEQLLAVPMQQ